jgi:SOS-response transcriptional repressor LexA
MDLTKRQQEIFDFIKRDSAKYGYPPTVRDIGKAVGLASSSTVHAHLANLERSPASPPARTCRRTRSGSSGTRCSSTRSSSCAASGT